MRNFFNSHWKAIIAILLAIVLATLTAETKSDQPPIAARLHMHAQALAPGAPGSALRHVETSLRRDGYAPQTQTQSDTGAIGVADRIEAAVSNLAPGRWPSRTFIVGARIGPDGSVAAAAVLELAHAVKDLHPAPGTEIRFVFFVDQGPSAGSNDEGVSLQPDIGNFLAFIGNREAAQRVRQAFIALRSEPLQARPGLATSAHVMGSSLSSHGAQDGTTALVMTGGGFLRYPYVHIRPLADPAQEAAHEDAADLNDYDGIARVVTGVARTLTALAGVVEA